MMNMRMELLVMALKKRTHTILSTVSLHDPYNSLSFSGPEVVEHLPNALALVQLVDNRILYSLVLEAVEVLEVVYGEGKVPDVWIAAQIKAAQSL